MPVGPTSGCKGQRQLGLWLQKLTTEMQRGDRTWALGPKTSGEGMRSTRQRRRNEREGAPRAPSFTGREDHGGALSWDREGLGIPGEGGLCRQRGGIFSSLVRGTALWGSEPGRWGKQGEPLGQTSESSAGGEVRPAETALWGSCSNRAGGW